jgi:hypothetical protein
MFDPSVIESLVASIPSLGEILSADGKGNVDIDLCDLFNKLKTVDVSSLPTPLANLAAQFGASNPCETFHNFFGKDKCGNAPCGSHSTSSNNNNNNNNNNNSNNNNGICFYLYFYYFICLLSHFFIPFLPTNSISSPPSS